MCVCVCVCETHLKDSITPSVLVLIFREQFCAHWQCVIFSREQLIFPVPFKGISFYTVGILTSAVCNSFSPPHGFTSIDELKSTGIVFRQSKTLVEVQVVISIIPGTKVVVHGITGNSLRNYW